MVGKETDAGSGLGAYLVVLRVPGAAAFSTAGAVGRLPLGMVGLGSVLLLTGLGRSFALAGLVAASIALAQGLLAPQIGRWADRVGQTRVLAPQLLAWTASLVALVAVAEAGGPDWLLVALGALVGASLPQVGALARARWSHLLGDHDRINQALAVESLIDEAVFIVGPMLVALAVAADAPRAGLLLALGIGLVGSSLFLVQRRTEPPVLPVASSGAFSMLANRPMLALIAAFLGIGAVFGLMEVGVVAQARVAGKPGDAGLVLALWASGSLVSGIAYGAVSWRSSPGHRFLLGAIAFAGGAILVALGSGSLPTLTIALVVAGLANAPTLITGNTLVPTIVPAGAVTEAYTWVGVVVFAGIAVGNVLGGALIDTVGGQAPFWASTLAAVLVCAAAAGVKRASPVQRSQDRALDNDRQATTGGPGVA